MSLECYLVRFVRLNKKSRCLMLLPALVPMYCSEAIMFSVLAASFPSCVYCKRPAGRIKTVSLLCIEYKDTFCLFICYETLKFPEPSILLFPQDIH